MTYSNAEERSNLIAGLRDLADFLEGDPEVPAPRWADMMVFPPHGTDVELKAEIDAIAALIGAEISDQTAENGHYTASRKFGPVEYKAVGIPARSLARELRSCPTRKTSSSPDKPRRRERWLHSS